MKSLEKIFNKSLSEIHTGDVIIYEDKINYILGIFILIDGQIFIMDTKNIVHLKPSNINLINFESIKKFKNNYVILSNKFINEFYKKENEKAMNMKLRGEINELHSETK